MSKANELANRINRTLARVPNVWAEVHGRVVRLCDNGGARLVFYNATKMRPAELAMHLGSLVGGEGAPDLIADALVVAAVSRAFMLDGKPHALARSIAVEHRFVVHPDRECVDGCDEHGSDTRATALRFAHDRIVDFVAGLDESPAPAPYEGVAS